jgi:hypothetical protein
MLKAFSRLKWTSQWVVALVWLLTVLFGIQSASLAFHETRHAAVSSNAKAAQLDSSGSDECSLCSVQHTKVDSSFVRPVTLDAGLVPTGRISNTSNPFVSTVSVKAQPRAPPLD